MNLKLNYVGLVATVLIFASLALPWFTVTMTGQIYNNRLEFTAYLYQIQGTVNEVYATAFPSAWFVYGALALVVVTSVCCLAGSFLAGRKGQLLLLSAGIFALLSMVVFGAGLLMSDYANTDSEPAAVMSFFPVNAFGITSDTTQMDGYHFVWWLSYGFWLTIVAAIMAFVAAVAPSLGKKAAIKSVEPKTA